MLKNIQCQGSNIIIKEDYMQIYDVLKKDHDKVKNLLNLIEKNTDKDLFNELKQEVAMHTDLEEEIFYEPLQSKAGDIKIIVKGAHAEHDLVEKMIKQLEKLNNDEEWELLFSVMKKNLEAHIKMEEEDMFSLAKKHFSSQEAHKMASEMTEKKKKLAN